MIDNIENKIESLHLQECSFKNRSYRNLAITLEASFFDVIERLPACQDRYILCSIVLTRWKREALDSFMHHLYLRYKKGSDLNLPLPPQSTICSTCIMLKICRFVRWTNCIWWTIENNYLLVWSFIVCSWMNSCSQR